MPEKDYAYPEHFTILESPRQRFKTVRKAGKINKDKITAGGITLVKVKEVMTAEPITVKPDQTIREVAGIFADHRIDGAPVINNAGKLIGLVTKGHILKAIHERGDLQVTVAEVMKSDNIRTVSPEDLVQEEYVELGRLPVVSGERVVGMFTQSDLMRVVIDRLKLVRNEMETIINSIHNPIISVDERGIIRLFNRSAEKLLGKTAEQVVGKNIKAFFLTSRLLNILRTGEAETTRKIRLNDKYFISNRTPVIRDGKIVGAVAVLQEITEIEEISQELQYVKELNAELDAIIQSSFDGLFVSDGSGKVLRVNKAFERITGLAAENVIGKTMQELIEEGAIAQSASLLLTKRKEPVTIMQENRNGSVTLVTGNPVLDENGRLLRVVTNVRDITELNLLKHKLEQVEELTKHYENELQQMKIKYAGGKMVASSPKMRDLIELVIRLAQVDSTVLIQGESGVGKELIAEIIRMNSTRKEGPFVKINCGAIPENLLESELFGYEDGAFTGARKEGKAGLFELATGGTLFLDEISELPLNLQVKLLRVIQEKEYTRVGGIKPIKIDIRIIAATNRDLAEMIEKKQFREDLFYRLNVVPIHVPPLRERREEIPALAIHFLNRFNQQYSLHKSMTSEVMDLLVAYHWPGNVRELENLVERLVVATPRDTITREDLPSYLAGTAMEQVSEVSVADVLPLKYAVESVERQILEKAFARFKTTRRVAQELGVNQSTVVRKAAKYNIACCEH